MFFFGTKKKPSVFCDKSELRAPILMCDNAKERETYFLLYDEKFFWSPHHLGVENFEKPPFLIDLYQYFIIIWDISFRKPPSCVCSSVNDNHLVCDKLCWVGDLGVTSVCIFGEMVRTRFGKSEPARFGYPNQVRNMSDVERYITLGVSKRCLINRKWSPFGLWQIMRRWMTLVCIFRGMVWTKSEPTGSDIRTQVRKSEPTGSESEPQLRLRNCRIRCQNI